MQKNIDLHGMSSDEAERELQMHFIEINDPKNCITNVKIIFGNGEGILKQAVIHYIESNNYEYKFLNSGSIEVFIPDYY